MENLEINGKLYRQSRVMFYRKLHTLYTQSREGSCIPDTVTERVLVVIIFIRISLDCNQIKLDLGLLNIAQKAVIAYKSSFS